jgi:AhpD family alkylhydroperoxidase
VRVESVTDEGLTKNEGVAMMRIDYGELLMQVTEAMPELERTTRRSSLEHKLLDLVKIRASQIKGCAYCLDMHTKDDRSMGEDEQRLYLVAAWREAPGFSPAGVGRLAWCEALPLFAETGASD